MTFGERGSNDNMTRQLFDFFVAFSRGFQGRMVIMPAAGLLLAVGSPARENVKITLMSPVSQALHALVTVSVGLKNVPREHTFYNIRCPCFKGRVKILLSFLCSSSFIEI